MNLSNAPAWPTGIILAICFSLAVEAGFRLHVRVAGKTMGGDATPGAGHIVSAALALLGLLIAFTFAMAADRYETRRNLVVQEATAISTVWLRQQLLDEPARTRLAALMRDYVRERQAFVAAGSNKRRLDADWARTNALRQRIWQETGAAVRTPAGGPLASALLFSTNEMFTLEAARRAALDSHVPPTILWTLIVYATASAAVMGYGLATAGRRHRVASTVLFLMVALTIALIMDLDEPRSGTIRIMQTPMDRAIADVLAPPARS